MTRRCPSTASIGRSISPSTQAAYVSQLSEPMMLLAQPIAIAVGIIVLGVMSVAARLLKMSEQMRVALIAPQQILLLIQFIGVSVAAWHGAYPDGYVPVPGDCQASFSLATRPHSWCFVSAW